MAGILNDVSYSNIREILKDCIDGVQKSAANIGVSGIASGFSDLDEQTDGFIKGKVYVVGGRPCMGKEEFMLSMINDIVFESRLPVLMFSTNNMGQDYVQRLLSIQCDISTSTIRRGMLKPDEWVRLDKGIGFLIDAPLFIHDCLDLPLYELREIACNCIREKAAKIIFIDCLQMIDFNKEEKNISERIAKIMHSLKKWACQFEVPIVVGSMLSRGVEYRDGIEGKQPQFMDLANSSYIEELADVVMMVHRPEYYHIYENEIGYNLRGVMEVYVKKNNLNRLRKFYYRYDEDTGILTSAHVQKQKNFYIDNIVLDDEELPF